MKNQDLKRFYQDDGKFDPKDFARLDKDGKISKDQIPDDVGTKVIANPTLAGTEDDLTGLQVGDKKYNVPVMPHLYKHIIHTYNKGESIEEGYDVNIIFYSTDELYTATTFFAKLDNGEVFDVQGFYVVSDVNTGVLISGEKTGSDCTLRGWSTELVSIEITNGEFANFSDNVIQIF